MKPLLRNIVRTASGILGLDQMGEKYKRLAVNYIFLVFYTTLEGVFVNTLLYKLSSGMAGVVVYRAVTYVAAAVTMHLAAYLVQRSSPLVVIRLGAAFYLLMYVVLFLGLNHMAVLNYFVAALAGTGGAFYWASHNIFVQSYTNKNNRDIGISLLGVIQGVITLFCPVISGFVIARMPGDTGYRVMFGLGMAAVLAQMRVQMKLHPAEQQGSPRSRIKLALRLLARKATYRMMMAYEFVKGMRDGTFAFILNMLLFEIITDEFLVGVNTFLTGIMAITGSWVFGRVVRRQNRAKITALATTLLLAVCSMLFLQMNAATVMLFTAVNAFMQLFILNCCSNTTFDVMGQNATTRKCIGETYAVREGFMAVGRLLGLFIMLSFPPTQPGYVRAMCLLTAVQYAAAFLMMLTQRILQRKETAAGTAGAKERTG